MEARADLQAALSRRFFPHVSWFLLRILWHIRVWINGGPFRKGDLVQVIGGAHAGRIAAVYEQWPSRGQVRIDLDEAAFRDIKDVFSYLQLCRVSKTEREAVLKAEDAASLRDSENRRAAD